MILVILMQRPKSEGLGAAFGGGVTENIFGAQTTNVLTKITSWLAAIFFLLTFVLSILYAQKSNTQSGLSRELMKSQAAPQTSPAPTAAQPSPGSSPSCNAGSCFTRCFRSAGCARNRFADVNRTSRKSRCNGRTVTVESPPLQAGSARYPTNGKGWAAQGHVTGAHPAGPVDRARRRVLRRSRSSSRSRPACSRASARSSGDERPVGRHDCGPPRRSPRRGGRAEGGRDVAAGGADRRRSVTT